MTHSVTLLVADDKQAEMAKKALDKYMLVAKDVIGLVEIVIALLR